MTDTTPVRASARPLPTGIRPHPWRGRILASVTIIAAAAALGFVAFALIQCAALEECAPYMGATP